MSQEGEESGVDGRVISRVERFFRFGFTGLLNTIFGYSVFALLYWLTEFIALASLFSFVAGTLFNYWTFGKWVYGDRQGGGRLMMFVVYGIVMLFSILSLEGLKGIGISPYIGSWLMLVPNMGLVYFLTSVWVFGERLKA